MFKIFLFTLLMAIAATSASNGLGYDYHTSTTTTHQQLPQQHHHQQQLQNHNDGWEKLFYYFNAPEEHFTAQKKTYVVKNTITPQKVKKNVQVIFIKPQEEKHYVKPQKVFNQVIQNIAPKVEDSTHIYLLTPEHNHHAQAKRIPHVQQLPQQQTTIHQHKPEVHFLSYHTPAEAEHIQQMIIEQYGGKPSEIVHNVGGSGAPVVKFINSNNINVPQYQVHHQHHQQQPQQQQQHQYHVTSENVNRQYLAPAEHSINVPQYHKQPQQQHHVTSESVNRQYLAPVEHASVENVKVPQHQHHVTSESVSRQYLAPAQPARADLAVDKNYAKNFLPSDIDVVPGSSYIPAL